MFAKIPKPDTRGMGKAPQIHVPIRAGRGMKWPPDGLPEWPPDFKFQWPPTFDFWWFYDDGFPVWPDREWSLDKYKWPPRISGFKIGRASCRERV